MTATTDPQAVVERMFEQIINNGDLDVVDELFAENYVDHGPMGDMVGRDAFKEVVRAWRAACPDVRCEVSNFVVDGDDVAWVVRATGTHTGDALGFPATGRPFDTLSANIGRFENGVAVEHWAEQGMFPFLVQIGIIPAPGQ